MKKIEFYKLEASGNDFILIDAYRIKGKKINYKAFARKICQRKNSIGADGLLVIDKSKKARFKMRIFNADGSEAEMCGNGSRCAALWAALNCACKGKRKREFDFETIAGLIKAKVTPRKNTAKVQMVDPFNLKLNIALAVLGRRVRVNFINTGVPHVVVFVQGLAKINVDEIGRAIRFHSKFAPAGANVNFVELMSKDTISVRTYERGVEAETDSCGTGSVAAAIISGFKLKSDLNKFSLKVKTKGKDTLKIYYSRNKNKVSEVFLEGQAHLVYKGSIQI
mgnify:CR=1 FL=1|tara:strand:+ start:83 stop:922 length:840 start_codon:yes stop_codon:yes gene_type:complete